MYVYTVWESGLFVIGRQKRSVHGWRTAGKVHSHADAISAHLRVGQVPPATRKLWTVASAWARQWCRTRRRTASPTSCTWTSMSVSADNWPICRVDGRHKIPCAPWWRAIWPRRFTACLASIVRCTFAGRAVQLQHPNIRRWRKWLACNSRL